VPPASAMPQLDRMDLSMRRALLRWYRRAGRHDLPWRKTRDPWRVLLAELMLQRTRADVVARVYPQVVARWATAAAFAAAEPELVGPLLRPLGFTHRFSRLQAAAEVCDAGVPRTYARLMTVPGVGRYAATATMCFAYGRRVGVVDPSVIRVLERFYGWQGTRSRARDDPLYWELATTLVPRRTPREWNFAMLDLAAMVCRPIPACSRCPIANRCVYRNAPAKCQP
jgi:A/G-specific adenine glycosylase